VSPSSAKSTPAKKPAVGKKVVAGKSPAQKKAEKAAPPVHLATKKSAVKPTPAKSTTGKTHAAVAAPARKAPVATTSAKPAAKPSAKPATKPVVKPPAKPSGPTPAKTATKPPVKSTVKPTAKPEAKHQASAKPVAVKPVTAAPAPRPAPAPRLSPTPKPSQAPRPTTPAPSNRFSERFSPPKPPARDYAEPSEIVKPAFKADPRLANAWKTKSARDLTEPELLAMPEGEYMNEKQLEFFRLRLQALKDDLLSNAGETTEHLREDTSIVPDPADRATIEEEHALELRTRDRERKLLKKISQSLARIEAGDYGYCDETGEPIGLGRLLARPTATLSLEAQQRRELKQKMFGD